MNRFDVLSALAAITLPFGVADAALGAENPASPASGGTADVVTREVAAYNAHDAATVAALHAPNAALTLLPSGKVLAAGSAQLLAFFTKNFSDSPDAKLTLEKQFVLKNVVVNHYTTGNAAGQILSIYDVQNGLIANEWLILG